MNDIKAEQGQIIAVQEKKPIVKTKKDKSIKTKIHENRFIRLYIESGNAVKSYMQVFKCSKETAMGNASDYLKSIDISKIMEAKGITDDKLLNVLDDGLQATRPYGKNGIIHADHATRHSYMVTGLKLKKRLQDEKQQGAVMQGLSIVINQKK